MRGVVALAVALFAATPARADLKADVETLVQANVKSVVANKQADFDKTVDAARVLVFPDGKTEVSGSLAASVFGDKVKKLTHKVEDLHVVVDADKKLAWFHGAIATSFTVDKKKATQSLQVSGIAVDDGGWKIHAIMYARSMQDRELYARAADTKRRKAATSGDAATAKLVAAWFDGGSIAGDRSKNVAVVVNGTSPLEVGNGAYAVNLVKAWDALKMWATAAEATVFANGEIAFVRADVFVPVKEQASAIALGVILVKENNVWRWVSISFTPS